MKLFFKLLLMTLLFTLKTPSDDDCEVHVVYLVDFSGSLTNIEKTQIVNFVLDYTKKIKEKHKISIDIIVFGILFTDALLTNW